MTGQRRSRTDGGRESDGGIPTDGGSEYDGSRPDGGSGHDDGGYGTLAVLVSVAIGLVVTALAYWWATGFGVFFENLFRVQPTVEGRGVGADWVASNTVTWLDFLVALTHAADVIMGLFILVMVFVHWAAFRRLAGQMRRGDRGDPGEVAADGGPREEERDRR